MAVAAAAVGSGSAGGRRQGRGCGKVTDVEARRIAHETRDTRRMADGKKQMADGRWRDLGWPMGKVCFGDRKFQVVRCRCLGAKLRLRMDDPMLQGLAVCSSPTNGTACC